MSIDLLHALCAYIPRDRVESIINPTIPLAEDGVALIADISGFTPLTEALTHGLSPDQGAEELTRALDGVFTPLIEEIHRFRGSVIKFGGDALIVWYPREPGVRRSAVIRRALTSAWRMQQAIQVHGQVPTPIGTVTLKMKVGFTYGSVKRFNLGKPDLGYEDILGGETLDRMADAEHHAEPGNIMLDQDTLDYLPQAVQVAEWRDEFAAVEQLLRPARPKPWPPIECHPDAIDALIELTRTYVPEQIYELLTRGEPQVAELKPVVSLFVQFHGIDYDDDPDVDDKLQTYFGAAQRVAVRYGGRVNRLITGDKGSLIHVIFGAPRTVEEEEVRATRCALDLQEAVARMPFISMQRIGVTVGRVFAGPVGSPHRHDYTTMGDSINLSARLMQNAADHQVLIEEAVRAQLDAGFSVTDLGTIMVKGKSAPIPVFAATGFRAQPSRAAGRRSMPIFGRDQEMAALSRRITDLTQGQGGVITLVGEVGMGKTHILTGLRTKFNHQPILDLSWAEGMCLAYGQTLSGYLFIDLLRDLIQLPPETNPEETSHHLADFCRDHFGPERVEATYPYLARFMGLPLADDLAQRLEGLSGESLRWQLFEVFRELISRLAEERPLVLALDDLQWADPTSIQLLESLLPLTQTRPLALILAMRPERDRRSWALREELLAARAAEASALDLTLGPLTHPSAIDLIAHHAPNLPDRLSDVLVDKSGGNPLFLVELVRTLEAQGVLDEAVDPADPAEIDVAVLDLPNSVQGLLLAQIDRLTTEARHTLQMASVIGRTFLYKVLDELAAGEQMLDRQLQALEHHDYIAPDDPSDLGLAYIFRHALIQESAYGTLLYQRRRVYHRQVARAMERLFPTQLAEQAGLLAFHYEQANDLDQAITYHLQAADQARLIWANEEAEMLYHKVLTLFDLQEETGATPDVERRAKTYLKIAQVHANALDFDEAQIYYQQAFALLEKAQSGGQLIYEVSNDKERVIRLGVAEHGPSTLDPGLSEIVDITEITEDLFEGLVGLDTELNIIPALASRWDILDEGKTYRVELRPNLKWSDGHPLTAHDFVFAWRRNLAPQTQAGMAYQLFVVEGAEAFNQQGEDEGDTLGIQAINDSTLKITLKSSIAYFPYLLALPITYPLPAHRIQTLGENWSKPEHLVCNGPFQIAKWQEGREICLTRNPHYIGFCAGNIDRVLLHYVEPKLDHYNENTIDWCRIENLSEYMNIQGENTLLSRYLDVFFISFLCNHPLFGQADIRQAFARAIDQKKLVETAWSNMQQPALGGVVPPAAPGHSPEIGLNFDPIKARLLLKRAGFESGRDFPSPTLGISFGFGATPEFLQNSWREYLGIEVKIKNAPIDEMIAGLQAGTIHLVLLGWVAEYPDPDSILRGLFHSSSPMNYFKWSNKTFDQLVEKATHSTNQQERLELYHAADQVLVAEDTAVIPLYYRQDRSLMRPGYRIASVDKTIFGGTFRFKNLICDD